MANTAVLIIAAVILLIVVVLLIVLARVLRTRRLKEHFGPEYDRTVDRVGDQHQAEQELEQRLERAQDLHIRSLTPEEVNHFALAWESIQAEFVDTPLTAVQKANDLILQVMRTRGYVSDDFEQRLADLSVDYPELASYYRELHEAATGDEQQKPGTEDLRQALIRARTLFENLLQAEGKAEELREKEAV